MRIYVRVKEAAAEFIRLQQWAERGSVLMNQTSIAGVLLRHCWKQGLRVKLCYLVSCEVKSLNQVKKPKRWMTGRRQ